MKLFRLALPLATLLAAAVFSSAANAAGWVTGRALSRPDRAAVEPQAGITPSGERIVAWRQVQPGTSSSVTLGIAVRIAPAGGDFGPEQLVGDANASSPTLVTGADDNAALAWLDDGKLRIARRPPGATAFTEATPFAIPDDALSPIHVAVQGGDVYVAFATRKFGQNNAFTTSIRAARLAAGATTVTALPGSGPDGTLDSATFVEQMQPDHEVNQPSIAVGGGTVHVAWEDESDAPAAGQDSVTTVRRATLPVGNTTFSAPIPVDAVHTRSFRADDADPRLVSGGGEVAVAWSRGLNNEVAARRVAADAPIQIVPTPGFAFNIHGGIDRSGAIVLAWDQVVNTETAFAVLGAQLPAGAATGTAQRLTRPGSNSTLDDFTVGLDGTALAVPDHRNDNVRDSAIARVQGTVATPGNPFGDLEEVSGTQDRTGVGAFDTAAAAVGADGRAIVGWTADDNSGLANNRYFLSERDATAPAIRNVSVPASALPGASIGLAAEASDALSPPVTLTWDFGDGSHGRGGLVSHAYGAPGTYTATITARDSSGNVASESRTIAVATPGPAADRTPPQITRLKSTRARFRVVGARAGTTFTLDVNERSNLVLSFKGKVRGHRVAVPAVLIRTRRGPGVVSIPFSGRVGGARLKPGSYVASVTAIDAAGNRSRPATVSFKVVPR
jgi:hypothetical protein